MSKSEALYDMTPFNSYLYTAIVADVKDRLEALYSIDSYLIVPKAASLGVTIYYSFPWTALQVENILEGIWDNVVWKFVGKKFTIFSEES